MDDRYLQDNTLLIIPNNLKEKILLEINNLDRLVDIKIMSKEEFMEHFFFKYDSKAYLYLLKKYNLNLDVIKKLLKNIVYVPSDCNNEKLKYLYELKQELLENNILITDKYFKDTITNRQIVVYGYDLDLFDKNIFDKYNALYIEELKVDKSLSVHAFVNIEEEVSFVFDEIVKLINKGIDIDKIKIVNVNDDYLCLLKRMSTFYNIPLVVSNRDSLLNTTYVKDFLQVLKEEKSFDKAIFYISSKYSSDDYTSIYNKVVGICNKYIWCDDFTYLLELLEDEFKTSYLENISKGIKCTNISDIFESDEYVFVLSFNQGILPNIYKDEDYLSDELKQKLLLNTSYQKNIFENKRIINKLKSINNLCISYKLKTPFNEYYKSPLIDEYNIEEIKHISNYSLSNMYNKVKLTKMLDKLIKYNDKDPLLDLLFNNYKIDYLTYDNKFTGIDKNSLLNYLNNKLVLSYSSIDNFYRCNFRYYINNILKLDSYKEEFYQFIGNLYHYVLSKAFLDNFNFDKCFNEYLEKRDLTSKELFFITRLKEELKFIIEVINKQNKLSILTDALYEKRIEIIKQTNPLVVFKGFVDKINYHNDKKITYVNIIDYKTGNPSYDLTNSIYGINMQLPVYLYLVEKSNLFSNITFTGFYLQKILNNEIIIDKMKTYLKQKEDNLKLVGYSNSQEDVISKLDSSYENSELIKGMSVTSKGFSHYTKLIDDIKIDKLINIVDDKIINATTSILNSDFKINPKIIGLDNEGCLHCKYHDLCYVKHSDFVYLKKCDLSYLGGDDNA